MRPINVAVTGNRPFLVWDYNTSALVRDALPFSIERAGRRDIRIYKYHRDTHDTYKDVRQVSKDIWSGDRRFFQSDPAAQDVDSHVEIDLIVHFGMEVRPERAFGFEKMARREGYEWPGDDGKNVDSQELKDLGLPKQLHTKLDVDAAAAVVKRSFPNVHSEASADAGLYFCEFRLFSSLGEAYLRHPSKQGHVVFVHIPADNDTASVELARDVIVTLISCLADDDAFPRNMGNKL